MVYFLGKTRESITEIIKIPPTIVNEMGDDIW